MNQNREQRPLGSEDLRGKRCIPPLNARNVNFLEGIAIQTGVTAADHCQEEWLHLFESLRQLGRMRSIVIEEPAIAFLPGLVLFMPKLFAKVFTNQRVRVQLPAIVRILRREKSRPS